MLKLTNERRENYRKTELAKLARNDFIQASKFKAEQAKEQYDQETSNNLADLLYNTFEKVNKLDDKEREVKANKKAFKYDSIPPNSKILEEGERLRMGNEDKLSRKTAIKLMRQENIAKARKARH